MLDSLRLHGAKMALGAAAIGFAAIFGGSSWGTAPALDAALVDTAATFPRDYFRSPIDQTIRLTGTFGELRNNHFHAGLDIDSKNNRSGQPIFAAAEGFVSKIHVQGGSYGNLLIVQHPNGFTTAYAHLDRFAPEIQQYVREQQYRREQFEVELDLKPTQFPVRAGQEIAKMGNTGGSSGPHLHFEIRHTATGKVANPELFGLPVADNLPPQIRDMRLYFLNEKREVTAARPFPIVQKPDGTYAPASGDTVRLGAWRVGFGMKAYDSMTGFRNQNGIYSLQMTVDGQTQYLWRMDEFATDETRYINAHMDFEAKRRNDAWFHRCFVLPGNRLSNYARTPSGGAVALYKDRPLRVQIRVADASGNQAEIGFWAIRDEANMELLPEAAPYQFTLPFDAESRVDLEGFSLSAPAHAFYETVLLRCQTTAAEDVKGAFSSIFEMGDEDTPVHKFLDVSIRPTSLPARLRDKAIIAKVRRGRHESFGGHWQNERLTAKIREFGRFCVMVDTVPPSISAVVFKPDLRKKTEMAFRVSDNFGTGGDAKGLSFRGEVDGKWVLFEHDKKRARLTHTFDGRIGPGKHKLRLTVRDDRGNERVFEGTFLR